MKKAFIWFLFVMLLGSFLVIRTLGETTKTVAIDTLKDVKSDTVFVKRSIETKIVKTWKDTVRLVKVDTIKTTTLDTLNDVKKVPRKPIVKK